jgi:hypothetical protein
MRPYKALCLTHLLANLILISVSVACSTSLVHRKFPNDFVQEFQANVASIG